MGKRVQVIQDEKGKFEKRICEACHMKMDEEEAKNLQKVNDNNNVQQQGPPPLVIANPNMKCSECNKIIIGNAVKANDNKYYHEQCLKCDKCQAKLANNKYGYINNQKWCSNCIQKRSKDFGDIKIDDNGQAEKKEQLQKGKIYMSELHKLNSSENGPQSLLQSNKNHASHFIQGGQERVCQGCKKVIKGPSIKVPINREYHRDCLDCDECHAKIDPKSTKILQDKKLCIKCSSKWTLNN